MIGQDTEFFLWDTQKDKVVPSYKFFEVKEKELPISLEGRKAEHFPPEFKKNLYSFTENSFRSSLAFRDGLAVEVNSHPTTCRAWLWQDIRTTLGLVTLQRNLPPHIKFTSRPWVPITPQLIRYFPQDLKILGCSPTLDAYKVRQKTIRVDPLKTYFRTSGAHLHMSMPDPRPDPEQYASIIKLCDLLIGLPFTYVFADELEFRRRRLYGQAGEFREQHYPSGTRGLEYRVLSSRLYNHPGTFGLFTGIWKYAIREGWNYLTPFWDKAWEDDLQEAINLGTPNLFPRLLNMGLKVLQAAGVNSPYSINLPLEKDPEPTKVPRLWERLRELNLQGEFPDAGVINQLDFAEAHTGWGEYRKNWGL